MKDNRDEVLRGIGRKYTEEQLEMRVQQRTRELEMLLEVSRSLASTLEMKPLFSTILTQLRSIVPFAEAALIRIEGREPISLDYQGAQSLAQMQKLLHLFGKSAFFANIMQDRQVLIVDDLHTIPTFVPGYKQAIGQDVSEEQANAMVSQVRCWMGVPLLVQERLLGIVTLNHSEPGYYTPRHARLALAVAHQAAIALENALLYERAQALAVLQERRRLAGELHDSVTQELYGISLGALTAREALHSDIEEARASIDHVVKHAEAALSEMRTLLFELRPELLGDESLAHALEKRASVLRTRYQLAVDLAPLEEPPLSTEVKHTFYRIAQEALHNVVRHAQASSVKIELTCTDEETTLEISDDGRGFDSSLTFPGHLGLINMQERLAYLGGRLTISSSPDRGTRIFARIPHVQDTSL